MKITNIEKKIEWKSRGFTMVEVLVSAAIIGFSLYMTMQLGSVNSEISNKADSSQGLRSVEEAVSAIIEVTGLEIVRDKKCSSASSLLNKAFTSGKTYVHMKNLSSAELSKLPRDMSNRCKSALSSSDKGFRFCKKLIAAPGSYPFIDRNIVVIEGAYLYKNHPKQGSYISCSSMKFDDPTQITGADYYYSVAHIRKVDLKAAKTMTTKRRYKYLRADKPLAEGI